MTVSQNTNITRYTKATIVKPKHALWMIKNDGATLVINNGYVLRTGQTLGVDALKIFAVVLQHYNTTGELLEIVNETEFTVASQTGNDVNFTLVETSYKISK